MGAWSGEYPRDLAKVIGHAKRFTKVLANLETHDADAWYLGRASELRGVVSLALADWRSGASDVEAASHAIVSYVDALHRGVAKRLRCGVALDCCDPDEVITVGVPEEWRIPADRGDRKHGAHPDHERTDRARALGGQPRGPGAGARRAASRRSHWRARLPVAWAKRTPPSTTSARSVARACSTRRARSTNAEAFPSTGGRRCGFKSAMIDGVRRWGPIPARERRRQQQLSAVAPAESSAAAHSPSEAQGTHDSSDSSCVAPAAGPEDLPVGVGEGSGGLGATPEDLLATSADRRPRARNRLRPPRSRAPAHRAHLLSGPPCGAGGGVNRRPSIVGASGARAGDRGDRARASQAGPHAQRRRKRMDIQTLVARAAGSTTAAAPKGRVRNTVAGGRPSSRISRSAGRLAAILGSLAAVAWGLSCGGRLPDTCEELGTCVAARAPRPVPRAIRRWIRKTSPASSTTPTASSSHPAEELDGGSPASEGGSPAETARRRSRSRRSHKP